MFNPFLESFPDDFSIEAEGQTYSAILIEDTETAQPVRRTTYEEAERSAETNIDTDREGCDEAYDDQDEKNIKIKEWRLSMHQRASPTHTSKVRYHT